jgi:lysophospholipase L1-like esterase
MPDIDVSELLARKEPVRWLFAGDSITQGARHTRGHRDYTQLFKERVGELARNEDIVINTAVGGWNTAALEPRLHDRVLDLQPDAVFLMFGTNDAAGGREELKAFEERYVRILNSILQEGIQVILQTTIPMLPVQVDAVVAMTEWPNSEAREAKTRGWNQRMETLESYTQKTREVAARCQVPLVDHWEQWIQAGGCRGQLLDGGFHPNEYGHRFLAHSLFKACGMWDVASWTCRLSVPVD